MGDVDGTLLDRVFQPAAERLSESATCFQLARLALIAAAGLQVAAMAGDLAGMGDPVLRALTGAVILLTLAGVQAGWAMIARAERQSRPGVLNVRRITLRWQRHAWLLVSMVTLAAALPSGRVTPWLGSGAALCWSAALYFASCTSRGDQTVRRASTGLAWAAARV